MSHIFDAVGCFKTDDLISNRCKKKQSSKSVIHFLALSLCGCVLSEKKITG